MAQFEPCRRRVQLRCRIRDTSAPTSVHGTDRRSSSHTPPRSQQRQAQAEKLGTMATPRAGRRTRRHPRTGAGAALQIGQLHICELNAARQPAATTSSSRACMTSVLTFAPSRLMSTSSEPTARLASASMEIPIHSRCSHALGPYFARVLANARRKHHGVRPVRGGGHCSDLRPKAMKIDIDRQDGCRVPHAPDAEAAPAYRR